MYLWSKTPANNATADPVINFREGQSPSTVNDSARNLMSRAAMWRDDISGSLVLTGTSSSYALTTNQNFNPSGSGSLADGLIVSFRPNVTNAAGATLNIDSTGNVPLRIVTGQSIPAGYLIAGTPYRAYYNQSTNEWIVVAAFGNPYNVPIGGLLAYTGDTPPNSNFILPYGQAISRTTYAAYFNLSGVGTRYGSGDGSTTFNVLDLRGRSIIGQDNMGGSAAGRLTSAGSGIDGTTVGASGGAQNVTLARSALPNVSLAFTGDAVANHVHPVQVRTQSVGGGADALVPDLTQNANAGTAAITTTGAGGHTPSGSIESMNGNVTQTAVRTVQPAIVLPMILRVI